MEAWGWARILSATRLVVTIHVSFLDCAPQIISWANPPPNNSRASCFWDGHSVTNLITCGIDLWLYLMETMRAHHQQRSPQ